MRSPDEYARLAERELEHADDIANTTSGISTEQRDRAVDYFHGRALVLAELASAAALADLCGSNHAPEKVEVERDLADDLDRERYGRKS